MEQETLDKLYEDFTIEIKPGKGSFKYVRTRHILDRMNKAFKGNWGTHIISHSEIGDEVLVLAAVYIYNEDGHILAQQQGFGSAKKFNGVELGNTYKSATSKAIKSAVRNWGVALFLEEGETGADYTSQSTVVQTGSTAIPQSVSQSMPSMPQSMPSFGQNTPVVQTPVSTPSMPSMPQSELSMPTTGSPVGNIATTFPGAPLNTPTTPVQNDTPSGLPTMTAMPGKMPTTNSAENTQANITSVQKVAIMSRLASKGKTFEDICADFYSNKPNSIFVDNIDDMTYTDALDLVSFLNSK